MRARLPLFLLSLLVACGSEPADLEPREVVHLVDHWTKFRSVEGSVVRFQPPEPVFLEPVETRPWENGRVAVILPWRPVEGSLKVWDESQEVLEPVRYSTDIERRQGYLRIPPIQVLECPRMRVLRGRRARDRNQGAASAPSARLEKSGDHVGDRVEFLRDEMPIRLLARSGLRSGCTLDVFLDGEKVGEIAVRGAKDREYPFLFQSTRGMHEVRFEARAEVEPQGREYLASLTSLILEQAERETLIFSESKLPGKLAFLPQSPEREEQLRPLEGELTLFSIGGDMILRSAAESATDSPPSRQFDSLAANPLSKEELAEGVVLKGVPAGLHTLSVSLSDPVRVNQPLADLVDLAVDRDAKVGDFPAHHEPRQHPQLDEDSLDRVISRVEVEWDRRVGFWLPTPSRLVTDFESRAGDRLRCSLGVPKMNGEEEVTFRILLRREKEEHVLLDSTTIEDGSLWAPRELAIPSSWSGAAQLVFETTGNREGIPAVFGDPRLVPPRVTSRPNVIVYLIDTLRADYLTSYGADPRVSPYLHELGQDGFVFEDFFAVASWTRPTTATVLTGLYPTSHGVSSGKAMSSSLVTMGELMGSAGYSSWAAVANAQIGSRTLQFEQGFHRFVPLEGLEPPPVERATESSSGQINDTVIPWLDENRGEPFFLYLHSLDPHAPYRAPGHFQEVFGKDYRGPQRGKAAAPRIAEQIGAWDLNDEDVEYIRDTYRNEIAYQDLQIQRLVDALEERDLLDNTVIMVLSDHGEEFLDHGDWIHGHRMWQELVRVPLILWMPEGIRRELGVQPKVVADPVSQLDLVPTVTALLNIDDPYPRQGESLLPLLSAERAEPRVIYGEEVRFDDDDYLGAIVYQGMKLIWKRDRDTDEMTYRLFDLGADPAEQNDLAEAQPEMVKNLLRLRDRKREAIQRHAGTVEAAGFPSIGAGQPAYLDDRARRQLEALGYLGEDEH